MMSISIVSYPAFFILSVFESESGHKYENKYDISDIRPYLIRFHPYSWWHGCMMDRGVHTRWSASMDRLLDPIYGQLRFTATSPRIE
jgi:hypothetical protein